MKMKTASIGPLLSLRAAGVPAPQGSKRLVRGRMIESSRGLAAWRNTVAMEALAARRERGGEWPITGPVRAVISFDLPGRASARPDVDKLARAVLDALVSARVLRDDSQVVELHAAKRRAADPILCGAAVSIWEAWHE